MKSIERVMTSTLKTEKEKIRKVESDLYVIIVSIAYNNLKIFVCVYVSCIMCFLLNGRFFKKLIGVQLIYNMLVSGVQQSVSVIHISFLFQILFLYRLSQKIE